MSCRQLYVDSAGPSSAVLGVTTTRPVSQALMGDPLTDSPVDKFPALDRSS